MDHRYAQTTPGDFTHSATCLQSDCIQGVLYTGSQILCAIYLFIILVSGIVFAFFASRISRAERAWEFDEDEVPPKVAAILSMRGADPALQDCVEGLCQQDYPNKQLLFLVDHPDDLAGKVVRHVLSSHPEIAAEIQVLQNPPETCALKCAALSQGVHSLGEDVAFVAFIDGDVIPHKGWLRQLIAPFQNEKVDITTGYRWFVPEKGGLGSLVRYFWNAVSYVHVYLNHVIWGGSWAIRKSVLESLKLETFWEKSLSEDEAASRIAIQNHRQIFTVPQILMVNREKCSLSFTYRWCSRQMFLIWYGVPKMWKIIFPMTLFFTFLHGSSLFLILWGSCARDTFLLWLNLGGLLFFWLSTAGMAIILERLARWNIAKNQEPVRWKFPFMGLQVIGAMPLTLIISMLGFLKAQFCRKIVWRNITYRVASDRSVTRENYAPFKQNEDIAVFLRKKSDTENISIE